MRARSNTRRRILRTGWAVCAARLVAGPCLLGLDAAARADEPLYNETDLTFLQHMIVHHAQAVEMCAWVPTRSDRDDFVRYARYVERAQAAEIEKMKALLAIAADRGLPIPEHHLHGDPPMAGMLSTARMKAIESARGAEFERLWLEGMIVHHDGAVDMARVQQQQQLESARQPYELATLVEDILIEQRAEIAKMRGWLDAWRLAR